MTEREQEAFVAIIKRIIAEQGEDILPNLQRMFKFILIS
jgi:hypothetical protein